MDVFSLWFNSKFCDLIFLCSLESTSGFEALTEIQNLLNNSMHDPSLKESLIIDASNRFFTVIPSIHPHIIRDEDDFKSKVIGHLSLDQVLRVPLTDGNLYFVGVLLRKKETQCIYVVGNFEFMKAF